ncbi:MAG TPA: hypothetical protein VL381_06780 [Rhodocyclaceae bacterium]|nr:hypothetical protein [Rhodocyclaceae bacterium]
MFKLKAFINKSIQEVSSRPPPGITAVAVFFYGPPPALADISALAVGADVAVKNEDGKTRIHVTWSDVNTIITIDPNWDKAQQMEGMRGWVERFPQHVRALPDVAKMIESFDDVSACYGTVSKPGLDVDNKVVNLLKALLGSDGGFFFSRNSFYGTDALRITGFSEDPMWLGTPPAAT